MKNSSLVFFCVIAAFFIAGCSVDLTEPADTSAL